MWRCQVFKIKYLLVLFVLSVLPNSVFAAGLVVTPAIIDIKANPRGIISQFVILKNEANYKLNLYVFVNNVDIESGEQRFLNSSSADLSASLANWIEFGRGVVELSPGENKKLDFNINVNPIATPGIYHAVISFALGSTREEAESRLRDSPNLTINLEVLDDAREKLQLLKFAPDSIFYFGLPVSFNYLLENIGNKPLQHHGRIIIYNRRGQEVVILGLERTAILAPGESKEFNHIWKEERAFGRYKAFLDIDYGGKAQGAIQDTIFFWVIPWKKVAAAFAGTSSAAILITMIGYSRFGRKKKRI